MPKQKIDKIDDFACNTVQRYEGSFKRNELLFIRIQKKSSHIFQRLDLRTKERVISNCL